MGFRMDFLVSRFRRRTPRIAGAVLAVAMFGLVTSCTLVDRLNPYDPGANLASPGSPLFNIADHVTGIGPNGASLSWSRSVENDFYFYAVCRHSSDFNVSNVSLTSDESNKMATELAAVPVDQLGSLTAAQIASKLPTLSSKFHAVSILPSSSANSFADTGLTSRTGYYYAIATFLKNLRTFKATPTLRIETSPDIASSRTMDLLWSFADIPGVVHDIDIDTGFSSPQIVISGYAWNLINFWAFSNRSVAYDYYVARIPLETGFDDSIQGFIYEPYAMLMSQFTNLNGTIGQVKGVAAGNKGEFFYSELAFGTPGYWKTYQYSNAATTNKDDIADLELPNRNSYLWDSDTASVVNDYTTYLCLDNSTRKLYQVGNRVDVLDANDVTVVLSTVNPPASFRMRMNGVALDSSKNIIVTDTERQKVYRFPSGSSGTVTPTEVCGGSGTKNGQFNGICDIAIDANGNLYVADTGNHRVQKFTSSGTWLSTYNLRDLGGNRMEGPRGLKYYNGKLYVGCTRSVVELVL